MPVSFPGLSVVTVRTSWDAEATPNRRLDLDLAVLLLNREGKVPADDAFVFFNNLASADRHVRLEVTAGAPDEQLVIDLAALPAAVESLVVAVSIYGGSGSFGELVRPVLTVDDAVAGRIAEFDVAALGDMRAAVYCELSRAAGRWRLAARGLPFADLFQLVSAYGVDA